MCDLDAELEGVLAHQIREAVLAIEVRSVKVIGPIVPGTQFFKTRKLNIRQPSRTRDARVYRVARAIGNYAGVGGEEIKKDLVVAKPHFIQDAGIGSPIPAAGSRVGAYIIVILERLVHER